MLSKLGKTGPQGKVHQDFLYGTNGAPRLAQTDMEVIRMLHKLTTTSEAPVIATWLDAEENLKVSFTFILGGKQFEFNLTNL